MHRVLVLSLWAAAGVAAQVTVVTPSQTRAPSAIYNAQSANPLRPEDACALEGKTVNSVTGEPVKWANLTLQGGAVPARAGSGGTSGFYTTTSDGEGKFAMKNVPPGRYRISAQRSGFGRGTYGVSGPGGFGALMDLAPGQRMTGLELKLQPLAVIAGRVLDEHGEPVTHASVSAMSYGYSQGGKQLLSRSTAYTNDLGEYRAFELEQGRYYLAATYRPSVFAPSTAQDRSAAPPPEEVYTTTYYPGTTEVRSAAQVEVAAGAVVENINLQMAKSPAVRVRGSVVNQSGTTGPNVSVMMVRTGELAFSMGGSMGASVIQGQFEFRGVTPGRYTITASAPDGQKRLQGRQVVDVGSANVEDVTITLGAGFDVPGKVRVDGQTKLDLQLLSVVVQPAEPGIGGLSSPVAKVDAEGNFMLAGIWPGRYLLRVSAPSSFYVKSLRLGSEDVLDSPLDLTGGAGGALSIVLGTDAGEVSGAVTREDGTPILNAMVVLIPESAKRRELQQYYRGATTDPAGRYKVAGVPPGRYKLFAWERIPNGAWMDPDVLKPVESKGAAIEIQEGGRDTVDLRALPAVE